jgi:hypothetical protein
MKGKLLLEPETTTKRKMKTETHVLKLPSGKIYISEIIEHSDRIVLNMHVAASGDRDNDCAHLLEADWPAFQKWSHSQLALYAGDPRPVIITNEN